MPGYPHPQSTLGAWKWYTNKSPRYIGRAPVKGNFLETGTGSHKAEPNM